jgi:hypothetical protein
VGAKIALITFFRNSAGIEVSRYLSMTTKLKLTSLAVAAILCAPVVGRADTQTTHHTHKVKKQTPPPPPLPSGPRGPVPQVPLDALPAVPPQVSYQNGLLTIVAPNSTLSEILRGVRKHTAAEIEIPANANERVATNLGPAPAREVMAELLNGSRFNYILLGSANDANQLVRVVLVAKTGPDNPEPSPTDEKAAATAAAAADAQDADAQSDDAPEDTAEQQPAPEPEGPPDHGIKSPQQMLQEMQQRQLQMQQQSGQPGSYPSPNAVPMPGRPPVPQPQQQPQDEDQ